ncbi:Maltose O-acetyltransferase [Fulvia fulva]|uniref:Maltose O-acetyltransferase n=1 Tax=Passalora fulva TaxID=5499 RepID=A0A9Q8L6E1_PASFU|nr:Maltose O-acetyltransferase [Fulvia fulva]KAK4635331.1 Maltose O-acetyltransferase [Fulvia fulva]KAK4637928.1 Maltose O-acetyltransferase [Fulvia fulva]UJO11707.1 Maltose O-acetyltransferase [Fulvia fulva]WPV09974.1 Maltose O-acetyltransferase [Fulvia fulva]WPV23501.1 Maltose O-acetyltransferase [Fulvia fulva]
MAATQKDPEQIALARNLKHVPRTTSYNSLDLTLEEARYQARKQTHEYNQSFPAIRGALGKERLERLKNLLGHIADDQAYIEPPFQVDYGANISIGTRFYANFNLCILDCGLVTIGDRVIMGPHVSIFAATHEVEVQSRRENVEYAKPVVIGDDCWIGGHVVILPGVRVGKGVTVAAGSIVTKSVEDWSVVMGQPARVVKKVQPVEDVVEEVQG